MTYEKFLEQVKEQILSFLSEEYANADVTIQEVSKNNNQKFHAICIKRPEDRIVPNVYLEDYCRTYEDDGNMENILTAIARIYQKNMENNENLLPFEVKDYESVKNRLYVVALNRNNNKDSNTAKINGATAILYPNLLQEIGEATQSNFFILPSSIHEVILMKDNGDMNAEELQRMVMEINRTQVAPEEVLSDEVYSYDYRQQKLTMATSPIQTKELLDQITGMCDHGDFMEEEQEADLCMGE